MAICIQFADHEVGVVLPHSTISTNYVVLLPFSSVGPQTIDQIRLFGQTHMPHIRRLVTRTATVCHSHRHRLLFTATHKSVRVGKQTVLRHSVDSVRDFLSTDSQLLSSATRSYDVHASGPASSN